MLFLLGFPGCLSLSVSLRCGECGRNRNTQKSEDLTALRSQQRAVGTINKTRKQTGAPWRLAASTDVDGAHASARGAQNELLFTPIWISVFDVSRPTAPPAPQQRCCVLASFSVLCRECTERRPQQCGAGFVHWPCAHKLCPVCAEPAPRPEPQLCTLETRAHL